MSEINVIVRAGGASVEPIPPLDTAQSVVREAAARESLIVRGAPGSGRTTCALAVLADAIAAGSTAMMWAPDRSRVDALETRVQALAPTLVRPVRTPAAFAYLVVSTWRISRADPLGPLELVTGAQEDQIIRDLLATTDAPWPSSIPAAMREMPAFRMEVRNLFARAGEAGIDGPGLSEFGRRFERAEWIPAGVILGAYESEPGFAVSSRESMTADTSRIQRIAARVLSNWDKLAQGEGVSVAPPVPDLVVVDDLQDCTASTVELLGVMAGRGTRVVAFADPDVAVATYRGGEPHLDQRLAADLGATTLDLGEVHRGSTELRDLVRDITGRITQTGPVRRRTVGIARAAQALGEDARNTDESRGDPSAASNDLSIHLAASEAQLGALVARHLREHHLHGGIGWEDQVVIVRSSGDIDAMRSQLRRGGVPLAGRRRAFSFSSEPATRILLELLASGLPAASGGPGSGQGEGEPAPVDAHERDLALASRLLGSPYVSADPLDVHRVLRALNGTVVAEGGDEDSEDSGADVVAANIDLVSLLEDPSLVGDLPQAADSATSGVLGAISRAAAMWSGHADLWHSRPGLALWKVWDHSGVAEDWRAGALRSDGDSDWYDDQLDAVLALVRVADVWEQRNPGGQAGDFARQLLGDRVPTDTIARTGQRPPGVEVLTPAQAMGRDWEVVWISGLQDGLWPNLRLRDRIMRADLLAEIAQGRVIEGADGRQRLLDDPTSARRAVLDDELRLFAAAASRSRRILHLGAVSAEQQAPSRILDFCRSHATVDEVDGIVQLDRVPAPLDLVGQVGQLRHLSAQPEETPLRETATTLLAVLAREGVSAADPSRWTGVGGVSTDAEVQGSGPVPVSPSRVQAALECPLKWFFSSSGGAAMAGDVQQLGTLVHAIAERHPHGPEDVMLEDLHRAWDDLGYDPGTWVGQSQRAHAEDVVRALASYVEGVPGEVRTEVPLRVRDGDVVITGSIDRLETVDGGVRLVDLKTGRTAVSKADAEAHPQLATYQVALAASGVPVVGARLEFLGSGRAVERDQTALNGERLDEWRGEIHRVAGSMRGPAFTATPSDSACRFCPFDRSCPAKDQGRRTLP